MNSRRSRLLALTLAPVVATLLVTSLAPADAVARAGSPSPSRISQRATAALDQAKALVTGELGSSHGVAAGARGTTNPTRPLVDASEIMRKLYLAQPSMTRSQRAQADAILARPTDGPTDPTYDKIVYTRTEMAALRTLCSTHFCVHYTTARNAGEYVNTATNIAMDDSATDLQARTDLGVLEYVWSTEVNTMGFHAPLDDHPTVHVSDTNSNPDSRVDIYLTDLGKFGAYGYCAPDIALGAGRPSHRSTAYCVLDNDFKDFPPTSPLNALKVTAAHEFFHAIQFGYNASESRWLAEGSAVWMEDQVYNSINDYLQYVPSSPIRRPLVPFTANGEFSVYGDFTLFKFLSKKYDKNFVKQMWQRATWTPTSNPSSLTVLKSVLAKHHTTLARAIPVFARWNTLPAGSYPERRSYGPAGVWRVGKLAIGKKTKKMSVRIKPLASAPLVVIPTHKKARARALVTIKAPKHGVVWVQFRRKNGTNITKRIRVNRRHLGTLSYRFRPKATAAVLVIMTNTASSGSARAFRVQVSFKR